MSTPRCLVCDTPLTNIKRSTKKYCSNRCKSRAFALAHVDKEAIKEGSPTFEIYNDILKIERVCFTAYVNLLKIMSISSVTATECALNAVIASLNSQGKFYNYEKGKWENGQPINAHE